MERANLSRTRIFYSMAITNNLWLRGAKQRLGGVVLYQAQGETRMRELAPSVTNPRTANQMAQRVRWANLVNFYRANSSWMKRAFENKPQNNTDYNRFMSLNGGTSTIYLTKQEANAGACVVSTYRVTDGTLDSIEISANGQNWASNIYTGDLATIDENTTVGAFATALLGANAGLRLGDQLSFIRITQMTNANTGMPYIIVRKYEVLLDMANSNKLGAYLPIDYFSIYSVQGSSLLGVVNSNLAGGFALILSRTEGGIIRISPQEIVVANNDALITRYSSAIQQQTAAESYGEGTEVFLSSATADPFSQLNVPLALLSATINDAPYVSNDVGPALEDIEQTTASVVFNTTIQASAAVVNLYYWDSTRTIWGGNITGTIDGNVVEFDIPAAPDGKGEKLLARIRVGIDSQAYELDFLDNEIG